MTANFETELGIIFETEKIAILVLFEGFPYVNLQREVMQSFVFSQCNLPVF